MSADDPARSFADMAARIERIDAAEFGGAVVVVPPDGSPIAFLVSDPAPNLAQFWSTVQARIDIALSEAKAEDIARNSGFGMRR